MLYSVVKEGATANKTKLKCHSVLFFIIPKCSLIIYVYIALHFRALWALKKTATDFKELVVV